MQNTSWEIYAELRQQALAFLDVHGLIPETLYIAADGWVEAVYSDTSLTNRWRHVQKTTSVNVRPPVLETYAQQHGDTLRIYFNLSQRKPSLWRRLRRFVS